ncbi:putative lipid II flippase FtsW [Hydrogeniiclostridium mannosilyticum]|nr:putative lipid II flippase FtsW [Hydrogeniiclostridium mannosilyticum]
MLRRVKKKFKLFSVRSGMDLPLFFLVLVLLTIGLVMLFSASYAYAYYNMNGDSYYFIRNQSIFAVAGVIIMVLVSYFDYHHFHKFAIPILLVTYIMLVLMLVARDTPLVPNIKGAYRWLYIGPVNFQPSEIAKFALILIFAHLISINFDKMQTFRYGVLPYVLILGSIAGLVVMENHMSATLIILMLAGVMLFVGGVKLRWFGLAFGALGAAAAYLLFFTDKFTYAYARIAAWQNPFDPNATAEILADTWQTRQSLMAIGSGGLLGLGLGQSRQKYLYLPEPQNDFIFSVLCEELGFIGALIVIILFAMLIWRGITVSLRAKDKFGMMLGVGLTVQIGIQVILNIMVVTNTIPNTGISLPFFSAGGTSLIILLAEMGILLSISRNSAIEKT